MKSPAGAREKAGKMNEKIEMLKLLKELFVVWGATESEAKQLAICCMFGIKSHVTFQTSGDFQ